MKRMMFLGALILGVTVCTQSFGFELLDRMLGGKGCTSCCEPGCDAGNGCAEPGCGAGNGCAEPACGAGNGCAEPSCGAAAGCCGTRKCATPIRDLLRAIHAAKKACHARKSCCDSCCGEPDCSAGNGCCEPACGAGNGCVESAAAPTPDASASTTQSKVVAVSRTVAAK